MPRRFYRKKRTNFAAFMRSGKRRRIYGMQRPFRYMRRGLRTTRRYYRYTRHAVLGNIAGVASTGSSGNIEFRLNQLPSYGDFTPLYDAYRINKVDITFRPIVNQLNTGSTTALVVPNFATVIDYDSAAAAPANINELREYENCVVVGANEKITRHVVPRIATPVYRDNISAAYVEGKSRQWVDLSYVDVPHYGVRWAMEAPPTNDQFIYAVECVFDIEFKNVR